MNTYCKPIRKEMEQLIVTNHQKEDLSTLIMECLKTVLNEYVIENKKHESEQDELLIIEDVQRIFRVSVTYQ